MVGRCFKSSWRNWLMVFPPSILVLMQLLLARKVSGFTLKPAMSTLAPAITDVNGNETSYVGGLAILKCTVINLGTRTVVWRRMDSNVAITVGTLTYTADDRFQVRHVPHADQWNLYIKDVELQDAGGYECQISSKDRSIRRVVYLTVKGVQISPTTYVEKGDRIVLSCNATSDDIDWYKKGRKVTSDQERGISMTKQVFIGQQMIVSYLEVAKATMEDDSDYVCRSSDLVNAYVKVHVLNAGTLREPRENTGSNSEVGASTSGCASERADLKTYFFVVAVTLCSFLNVFIT